MTRRKKLNSSSNKPLKKPASNSSSKPGPKIYRDVEDWKSLEVGEEFKCIQGSGPYYVSKESGDKSCLGYHGIYKVKEILEDGILAHNSQQTCYIYMGEDKIGISGSNMTAHKIQKLGERKRKYAKRKVQIN